MQLRGITSFAPFVSSFIAILFFPSRSKHHNTNPSILMWNEILFFLKQQSPEKGNSKVSTGP